MGTPASSVESSSSTKPIPIPMFKPFLFLNAFGLSTTPLYHLSPFQFSIRFFNTAPSQSFTVSYLIHKFSFSHEFAIKASEPFRFKTSQKPDSVINFFKNHGFTYSDIHRVFTSDIVRMVVGNPKFVKSSLKNHEITVSLLIANPTILQICLAKRTIPLFESLSRFLKTKKNEFLSPFLMLVSIDKIDLLMSFWVNQLGWNSLTLTKNPNIFSYALEKRIIPRALVEPFSYSRRMFLSKFGFSFKEDSDQDNILDD
ncbi:mTERF protein [Medicago truncatula]|uniref:mTERF protein n=1 Tax=Medicago truncatula TaxID=3880 RepID=G7JBY1_MEDTR|nr:mTERF protein [Medicago truncatula]